MGAVHQLEEQRASHTRAYPHDESQSMTALELANVVRVKRAEMKRAFNQGTLCVLQVLRDPPWYVQDMRAFELLEAAPRVSRKRLRRINMELAIGLPAVNLFAQLCELTERQRERLISVAFPHGPLPVWGTR